MNELDELAFRIDKLLSAYIAIHDDVLKFSLRKILPIPFIFRPINYGQNAEQLALISSALRECSRKAEMLQVAYSAEGSKVEFLVVAIRYVLALTDAISVLSQICKGTATRIGKNSDYTLDKYNRDLALYEENVRIYRLLGVSMTQLYRKIYT